MGVGSSNLVVVSQPKFMTAMAKMVDQIPLDDWKVYLKWNVIRDAASALSSPFGNERFDFTQKFLAGAKAMPPRWKRIIGSVNGAMGELLGQIYVNEFFPPEAKETRSKNCWHSACRNGREHKNLEWMSDATKEQALIKLSKFGVKIGYPDKWKDYSALSVERDSYFKNLERAGKWARKVNLAKLGKTG